MAGTVMCPPFFVRFLLLISQLMNSHKIIVLYGRGNLGKTRTLRMVIDILNGEPISYTTNDAQTICHYNDKTIAVATKGDNAAELRANVSYFKWTIKGSRCGLRQFCQNTILISYSLFFQVSIIFCQTISTVYKQRGQDLLLLTPLYGTNR